MHASAARLPWSPAPTSKTGLGLAAPPTQSRYVELEPRSSRATSLGLYPRQPQTSSSLKAIMETAWKTAAVDPVMVVMRSGQEPSEMVIRALLCGYRTSDGQRGAPRLSRRQHVCLPHPQAPAKMETTTLGGHSLVPPDGGVRGGGGSGIALPLPTPHPHLLPDPLYSLPFLQETKQKKALSLRLVPPFPDGLEGKVDGATENRTRHLPSRLCCPPPANKTRVMSEVGRPMPRPCPSPPRRQDTEIKLWPARPRLASPSAPPKPQESRPLHSPSRASASAA